VVHSCPRDRLLEALGPGKVGTFQCRDSLRRTYFRFKNVMADSMGNSTCLAWFWTVRGWVSGVPLIQCGKVVSKTVDAHNNPGRVKDTIYRTNDLFQHSDLS
jgi:hypothetical protein